MIGVLWRTAWRLVAAALDRLADILDAIDDEPES